MWQRTNNYTPECSGISTCKSCTGRCWFNLLNTIWNVFPELLLTLQDTYTCSTTISSYQSVGNSFKFFLVPFCLTNAKKDFMHLFNVHNKLLHISVKHNEVILSLGFLLVFCQRGNFSLSVVVRAKSTGNTHTLPTFVDHMSFAGAS